MVKITQISPEREKPTIVEKFLREISIYIWIYIGKRYFRLKRNPRIIFNKTHIELESMNKLILYQKIEKLSFRYYTDFFNEQYDYSKFSYFEFESQSSKEMIYFYASNRKMKKLCQFLYEHGINFKEYKNDTRVFLGKKPNYKEIQEIKEKYKVEW